MNRLMRLGEHREILVEGIQMTVERFGAFPLSDDELGAKQEHDITTQVTDMMHEDQTVESVPPLSVVAQDDLHIMLFLQRVPDLDLCRLRSISTLQEPAVSPDTLIFGISGNIAKRRVDPYQRSITVIRIGKGQRNPGSLENFVYCRRLMHIGSALDTVRRYDFSTPQWCTKPMKQADNHPDLEEEYKRSDGFPVVGVGASAGGLEAFQSLLSAMKPRHAFALVMVQHLDPDHESLLHELLSKKAHVPVKVIEDGMTIEEGTVHIIPPGSSLTLDGYTMHLSEFDQPRGLRLPIDSFFESLADEHGANCVGVILSGTGSDGSKGMRAIKNAGGLGLVQDPRQSAYDGMPRSAIENGGSDLVLPSEDIIDVIGEFFDRHSDLGETLKGDEDFKLRVAKHLLYRTGHDFSNYKIATMERRIARRMTVLGIQRPNEYLQRLISDDKEGMRLFQDILINVTSFFRDRTAFDTLQSEVIRPMLADKGMDSEVRIWAPGCSTGEEAYSIAILCLQEIDRLNTRPRISIFATDIDEDALKTAREGIYPEAIADNIPEDLLQRHFTPTASGYEVSQQMRDLVRFSRHNFIKDPPFLRLDLITCRNVIIYFDKWLQDRVMPVFHYALKSGAYLFIGPSENLGIVEGNFSPISNTQRIYRRDDAVARPLAMPIASSSSRSMEGTRRIAKFRDPAPAPEEYYRQVVLEHHAPAFAVIDRKRILTYTSGRIARYLEIGPGVPDLDLIDLARGPLRGLIRRLLASINTSPEETHSLEWTGEIDGETMHLVIYLRPLREARHMIIFDERDVRPAEDSTPMQMVDGGSSIDDLYLRTLEDELEEAQQTVRTTVEELETSNEELKSSNEEIMSMNEEMQSANEELTTVNDELRNKVLELDAALSDLRNFVDSTNIATLFLDEDLTIRSFSPEARSYFRVVEKDRNRHISDIAGELNMAELMELCEQVRDNGKRIEREMQSIDGQADIKVSVIPYVTTDRDQRGLVVVLFPVTELRQYARELEEMSTAANRHLNEIEELYRVSPQPMALMAPDLTYLRLNEGMAKINGKPLEDHYGKTIFEIVPNLSDQVVEPVKTVFRTGKPILGMEVTGYTAADTDRERQWEVDWYPIREGETVSAVGVSVRDVTKYHEMEMELRRVMRELQHRVKNMLANVIALINRARREEGDHRVILDTLVKRINALATTHNLLTSENWHSVLFQDLLTPELIDVYGPDRITLRGPSVRLSAKAAVAFGMTIHELATNAAKYGALGSPEGKLEVRWSRTDEGKGEMLVVRWTETGGDVPIPPEDSGFGTQLIDSTVRSSLLGSIEKHFDEDGFRAIIEVPIEELQRFDESTNLA